MAALCFYWQTEYSGTCHCGFSPLKRLLIFLQYSGGLLWCYFHPPYSASKEGLGFLDFWQGINHWLLYSTKFTNCTLYNGSIYYPRIINLSLGFLRRPISQSQHFIRLPNCCLLKVIIIQLKARIYWRNTQQILNGVWITYQYTERVILKPCATKLDLNEH